jgi:ADP-ribosylglycohydrolase
MTDTAIERLARALISLEGLSVGDAFGERFFVHPASVQLLIGEHALPAAPWRYTDDTQMALSIVQVLRVHGSVDQNALARSFGRGYDISRGYGPAMHRLLVLFRSGKRWQPAARAQFGGEGSYGNGGAMRVAPLGAYFADDLDVAAEQAARSAKVTHAHPEGIAGAIAVAVAAGCAAGGHEGRSQSGVEEIFDAVLRFVPTSNVRNGIERARDLRANIAVAHAAAVLGNGTLISAQDTVPFALWCAARHLGNYEEALWATVSGLGDRDTTCAIVGGIVACSAGIESIPDEWRASREPLPTWHLDQPPKGPRGRRTDTGSRALHNPENGVG